MQHGITPPVGPTIRTRPQPCRRHASPRPARSSDASDVDDPVSGASDENVLMETVTLWRPTGPEELALVESSGWTRWPPRLSDQPIFYPVLNEDYAIRIARDWNVKASGVGYVTRFEVQKNFLSRYEVQQVGGKTILEYWIPADDLAELNQHIVGLIHVVHQFR